MENSKKKVLSWILWSHYLCLCPCSSSVPLFLPFSDRHHVSSSIPVPSKSQPGVSAASEIGHTSSPDRGLRKRASSEADKYKPTPPPSYNTAMEAEQPQGGLAPPSPKHLSSSLDAGMASLNLTKTTEAIEEGEQGEEEEQGGVAVEVERRKGVDGEIELHKGEETEQLPSSTVSQNSSPVQGTGEERVRRWSAHRRHERLLGPRTDSLQPGPRAALLCGASWGNHGHRGHWLRPGVGGRDGVRVSRRGPAGRLPLHPCGPRSSCGVWRTSAGRAGWGRLRGVLQAHLCTKWEHVQLPQTAQELW